MGHTCTRWPLLLLLAPAGMAQIVTENAGTISPETPILRQSYSYFGSERLEELRWTSQLIVAPDTSREFKLSMPVLYRDVTVGDRGDELLGLGDISLRYKQSLWQRDGVMESTRWAFLTELGAPTGDSDAELNGVPIPRRLQLGTGDWSVGGGTAWTWIRDRRRFSAELFHRHRTRHDGLHLGPTSELNLAYWHRLRPRAFPPQGRVTEVRGVLELLSAYRFPSELGNERLDDDGAIVWLAPGLQVFPGTKVLFEASFQLPIHQDLDDALGRRSWAASAVIKILF